MVAVVLTSTMQRPRVVVSLVDFADPEKGNGIMRVFWNGEGRRSRCIMKGLMFHAETSLYDGSTSVVYLPLNTSLYN